MRVRRIVGLVAAAIVLVVSARISVASCPQNYKRFRITLVANDTMSTTEPCTDQGNAAPGTGIPNDGIACPYLVQAYGDVFSCDNNAYVSTPDAYFPLCPCWAPDQDRIDAMTDGSIMPGTFQCTGSTCEGSAPDQCTGTEGKNQALPANEGCGNDEHECAADQHDGAPVRFASGKVETNPLTFFELPEINGVSLGYTMQWGSHMLRTQALKRLVNGTLDTELTIHDQSELTHYLGRGWTDNYSDRLYISTPVQQTDTITWQHMTQVITFSAASGWKSWSGRYELIDRGANPADGFGRWVVRTTDPSAPRQVWTFEEFTYKQYDVPATDYRLGRLRRRAVLTSNLTDLNGMYGYTIDWTSQGTLSRAVDSVGRELDFDYTTFSSGPMLSARFLSGVSYRPSPSATGATVVFLVPSFDHRWLERVERVGTTDYRRFLYLVPPTLCLYCGGVVTDVIAPLESSGSTPGYQSAVLPREVVLEHDDYTILPDFTLTATHSKYQDANTRTRITRQAGRSSIRNTICTRTGAPVGRATVARADMCAASTITTATLRRQAFTMRMGDIRWSRRVAQGAAGLARGRTRPRTATRRTVCRARQQMRPECARRSDTIRPTECVVSSAATMTTRHSRHRRSPTPPLVRDPRVRWSRATLMARLRRRRQCRARFRPGT
jgi:hypothetical protein